MYQIESRANRGKSKAVRGLNSWYRQQITERTANDWLALEGVVGVAYLPSNRTLAFTELVRPLGSTVAAVLAYGASGEQTMFTGYRARIGLDGIVTYGPGDGRQFCHDLRRPRCSGLLAERNHNLFESMLRLDGACMLARHRGACRRSIPRLPRIWLGFAPSSPPEFEVTVALRRTAAERAGITVSRLAINPPVIIDELMRHTWKSLLVPPGAPTNPTGLLLIELEFCSQARQALRVFEDFREIVGDRTWNPARKCVATCVSNPAATVLCQFGISAVEELGELDQATVDRLEAGFRKSLGSAASEFTQDDCYHALVNPDQPLVTNSATISRMRRRLTSYWSACTADDDLRKAASNPGEPLWASRACRFQVLRQRPSLRFGPGILHRRIELDWEPRPWGTDASDIAARDIAISRPVESTA